MMTIIALDFKGCRYIGSIHKIIRDSMDFPEYYGENLSALWDCLDNYCEEPLHITIKGFNDLPKELDEYKHKMLNVFCRVHESTPSITFEILS